MPSAGELNNFIKMLFYFLFFNSPAGNKKGMITHPFFNIT